MLRQTDVTISLFYDADKMTDWGNDQRSASQRDGIKRDDCQEAPGVCLFSTLRVFRTISDSLRLNSTLLWMTAQAKSQTFKCNVLVCFPSLRLDFGVLLCFDRCLYLPHVRLCLSVSLALSWSTHINVRTHLFSCFQRHWVFIFFSLQGICDSLKGS